MSVRNYSVKNYGKIAPFPPSTKTFSNDRISSKRIYDLRSTYYREPGRAGRDNVDRIPGHGVRDDVDISDIENQYPDKPVDLTDDTEYLYRDVITHTDKPKHISKITNNVNRYTTDYLNNKTSLTSDKMMTRESKLKTKNFEKDKKVTSTRKFERKDKVPAEHQSQLNDMPQDVSKPLRPKSARPESRWERRFESDEVDIVSDSGIKPSRPKSARPTSRMMRMIEAHPDVDYNFLRDLPERPKTSHGRRHSIVEDVVNDASDNAIIDRPKSRLGRQTEVYKFQDSDSESDSESDKYYNMGKSKSKSNPKLTPPKKVKNKNAPKVQSIDRTDSFKSETPSVLARGSTMYDLNSKIDDIDLDVDPVEYFLQDDNLTHRGGNKKPSLSKDTIKFIGSTRKSHQDKVITGYHGYNQSKHYPKGDITDRYYGNSFQSPQYSISESNQRCVNQAIVGKINRQTSQARSSSLANGDVYQSRAGKNALRYSKAAVSRDVLAKYSNHGAINGYLTQTGTTSSGDEIKRKPRKLDPIIHSNMKTS